LEEVNLINAIYDRRSIRKYKSDPLSDDQIRNLLEAAMMAPSAMNRQPWHFVVCTDRELIDKIRSTHPYASSLAEAPVCIVMCADADPIGYYQQDCGAATENLLLAANEMGLGTCWMGLAPRPERMDPIGELLGLPEGIVPFNLIAVGYPDEERPIPARYTEQKVHYDRW
jgi:nitroreductase